MPQQGRHAHKRAPLIFGAAASSAKPSPPFGGGVVAFAANTNIEEERNDNKRPRMGKGKPRARASDGGELGKSLMQEQDWPIVVCRSLTGVIDDFTDGTLDAFIFALVIAHRELNKIKRPRKGVRRPRTYAGFKLQIEFDGTRFIVVAIRMPTPDSSGGAAPNGGGSGGGGQRATKKRTRSLLEAGMPRIYRLPTRRSDEPAIRQTAYAAESIAPFESDAVIMFQDGQGQTQICVVEKDDMALGGWRGCLTFAFYAYQFGLKREAVLLGKFKGGQPEIPVSLESL